MMTVWKEQQDDFPNMHNIIQAGLDKLEAYYERTDLAPAYMSAMSPLTKSQLLTC
jgi:hypothetical protein